MAKPHLCPIRRLTAISLLALAPFLQPQRACAQGAVEGFIIDSNHNGLSDLFELQFPTAVIPGADTDGDGYTNLQEYAAGTDPTNPAANPSFTALSTTTTDLLAQFQSVNGKVYQFQMSETLDAGTWMNEGASLLGDGTLKSGKCALMGDRMFLRMQIGDTDSDGDGVSDWEEFTSGMSASMADTDGDGIPDNQIIAARMSAGNAVTVVATDAYASELGPNSGTFTLTRQGNLNPLVVTFSLSGTATQGTDYTASPAASVYFPLGASTATVNVAALADALAESPETIILTITPTAGYTVGAQSAATVLLDDTGSGLQGTYYDKAETTYTGPLNFAPANLRFTRVDPTIEFNWGSGAPTNGAVPAPVIDPTNFCIRWTGQFVAQYSETYTFHWTANRGGKVWINGGVATTLAPQIDQWNGTSGSTYTTTFAAVAGRRYDIKVEYRESTSDAQADAKLEWSSPSQVRQVIPANRLYPTALAVGTGGAPSITSQQYVIGLVNGPFSYAITATNAPTSYAAGGLPSGLTLDTATGQISGTPSSPGLWFATVTASNASGSTQMPINVILVPTGGTLSRDYWTALSGSSVLDVPVHTTATGTDTLTSFDAPANFADSYGDRIRGYLTAPATGNFTFFITTNDENAELWISPTEDPARKLKRAWVQNASPAGSWSAAPTQRSLPVKLKAGQRYYIETVRKEGSGDDQLKVGWTRPGVTVGTAPQEIIPGYACSVYSTPTAAPGDSTLYMANLTPQAGAATLGTGNATLELNAAETEATLTYTFANLTGVVAQKHIHDVNTDILFDLDTAVDLDGNPLDNQATYHWVITASGSHSVAEIIDHMKTGKLYLNLHTTLYPNGEIKGFFQSITGSANFTPPAAPPAFADDHTDDAAAARFLQQTTFGPTDALITEVKSLGYAAWIDKQMDPGQTPVSRSQQTVTQFYIDYPRDTRNLATSQSSNETRRGWWKQVMEGNDQLRQRVAFALSQIFVVSDGSELDSWPSTLLKYNELLQDGAFGNFRNMLEGVTLNAGMGAYLDMLDNQKPDTLTGRTPNENYAREIMQLFSIGLNRLHPNGTLVLGQNGLPVATYGQDEVVALAHVFTGWQLGASPTTPPDNTDAFKKYLVPMILTQSRHATTEKLWLDGTVIPDTAALPDYNGSGAVDGADELKAAHDVLFHHPNTGPFISRQLIQRLVTANPSPAYIYRVSKVFADDGTGVRGNMGAVVKAILLDYEARAAAPRAAVGYGHLKEPMLRVSQVLRAFKAGSKSLGKPIPSTVFNYPAFIATNPSATIPKYLANPTMTPSPGWDMGSLSGVSQTPLRSPTVFNFFEPDYKYNGDTGLRGLFGPEFQITSETTMISYANFFYTLPRTGLGNSTNWEDPSVTYTVPGCVWTTVDNVTTTLDERFIITLPAGQVANLRVNNFVDGPGIPANTWIESISGNTITITRLPTAASVAGTSDTLTFSTKVLFPADVDAGNFMPFNGLEYSASTFTPAGGTLVRYPNSPLTEYTITRNYMEKLVSKSKSVKWSAFDGSDIQLDLTYEKSIAHTPEALMDRANLLLCAGQMVKNVDPAAAAATKNSYWYIWKYIQDATNNPLTIGGSTEDSQRLHRVQDLITIISLAPEFAVQK